MADLIYYIFADIPGQHPTYTVSCLATGEYDAMRHMRRIWGGGRIVMSQTSGKVKAACGDLTPLAQDILSGKGE